MPAKRPRPLWRCPRCGAQFVTRHMWHSCGRHTVEQLFAKSEPRVLALFREFAEFVRRCGSDVELVPQKTRAVFMARVRFAAATPRKDHFLVHIILPRALVHPRVVKHEFYPPRWHLNYVRIASSADLDDTLLGWLRHSHAWYGRQEGLAKR